MRSAGVTGSDVSTDCDGAAFRKASRDGNRMKPPVPQLQALFRKRRNSPPNLNECLPRIHARVSEYWNEVSPRPCGNWSMPPNQGFPVLALPTRICGITLDGVVIPKVSGVPPNAGLKLIR